MLYIIEKEENLTSDEEIISMYLKGELSAFRELLRRYTRPVMNFILKLVGNDAAAEELTQDVFFDILSKIDNFRGESKFKTYLFTVTRNTAIDFLRKAKYRKSTSIVSFDGENPVINTELKQAIEQAVEKLPSDQKEIFMLKEVAKLQFNEIAAMLKEDENILKSRMRYALLLLQKELKDFIRYE